MSGAKLCVICNKSIAVLDLKSVNYIPGTQEQANCDNRKDKILITPPREREILISTDIKCHHYLSAVAVCLLLALAPPDQQLSVDDVDDEVGHDVRQELLTCEDND